jgi:hypothetical protein
VVAQPARSAIRLVWPWRPLAVEPRVLLELADSGLRFTRTEGESRLDLLLHWKDVERLHDLPQHVIVVSEHGRYAIPRSAFAGQPNALAVLRERIDR